MSTSARLAIARGSKSFFLASLFFPKTIREASWVLYRWCRHCDDKIDTAPVAHQACAELASLETETAKAIRGASVVPVFKDLGTLLARYRIPHTYPFELLAGFRKDALGYRYATLEDVEMYSYQVAGVVGLMMAHIMGARHAAAYRPAIDLGIAMQLTNIARDIREDFDRGRIYLPSEWLIEAQVPSSEMMSSAFRERVYRITERLLERADDLYRSGYSGLKFLPFRAAIAVSVAGSVYSAIGKKIRRRGPSSLDSRIHIGFGEKLIVSIEGIARIFLGEIGKLAPRRIQ